MNKTRKYRGIRGSTRKKNGGTPKRPKGSKGITLTKRRSPKPKLTPNTLKKGEYYIVRSHNPTRNIEGKFERYVDRYSNGSLAIFSKEVVRRKIDEDTGEFYEEIQTAEYGIPVKNIVYLEKLHKSPYYTTHNLPGDIQKEIESYMIRQKI